MSNTKVKSGDKVVFCKSSLESGMIDAEEGDVFTVNGVYNRTVSLKELPGDYHKTHFEHCVEKEKVVEKYIPKVGDKVKGFWFDSADDGVRWDEEMGNYLDEIGEVVEIGNNHFVVTFLDGLDWGYPLELAHLAKIENTPQVEESSQEISQQDSQIDWQVGQEVFCILLGKGVVDHISKDKEIGVTFEKHTGIRWYTPDGKCYEDCNRTLFFSEPKIIAETKPPKKPFVPVFKQGDTIIVKWADTTRVLILEKETERQVKGMDGQVWDKDPDVHFFKLGEQVKFS